MTGKAAIEIFADWLEHMRDNERIGPTDERYIAGWEDAFGWVMDEFDERFRA